jgi:general secretion pathway protein G
MNRIASSRAGFTLIELVVTLALVGIVAMTALPAYEVIGTRMKESELRVALRTIRSALDAYKAAGDSGSIPRDTGTSGYPPSLQVLVDGVEIGARGGVTLAGQATTERLIFLRRVPRDPFHPDRTLPAAATWRLRSHASPFDNPQPGDDVYDVLSFSDRVGLNGVRYSEW